MSHNEERFLATIEINNEKAKSKIQELENEQQKYLKELLQLKKKESQATSEQIRQAERNLKDTTKALSEQRGWRMESLIKTTWTTMLRNGNEDRGWLG